MLFCLTLLDTEEEKSKFEQLYNLYRYTMFHVAFGILKNHQLAEDAVHEAFIRIAKNLHKIGDISCPQTKGFMVIIVKNVSLSMVKKQAANTEYLDAYDTLKTSPSTESEFLNQAALEEVVAVVLQLPDIYRDVLYLHLVEEYSVSEISTILQLTKETVKKRIQRGRKIIAVKLHEKGV